MLIFDIPRPTPSGFDHIDIPLYHRVHLSLAQGTDVHACLLATQSYPYSPELVISPFDFARWDRIWRLNLSVIDRPGLLHDVCEILRRSGVNVQAAESSSMEEQGVYHLEIVLEMEDEKTKELIEWTLTTRLFKELTFYRSGLPRLQLRTLQNLWLAKHAYETQRLAPSKFHPATERLRLIREPVQHRARTKVFRFKLPPSIRDILTHEVSSESGGHRQEGRYLRLSDTKDRFMRILFFRATDPVIYARMEYDDRLGAGADVTRALRDKGFNILAAFLAPAEGRNRARCEVVARCERMAGNPEAEQRLEFEDALKTSATERLIVGYPEGYGHHWNHHSISQIPCRSEPSRHEPDWIGSLWRTLDSHYQELSRTLRSPDVVPEKVDQQRWTLLHKLQLQAHNWWPEGTHNRKCLFISCHYHGNQLQIIKKEAEGRDFLVFTGEDLVRDPNNRNGLVSRISYCTHFLGVWSSQGALRFQDTFWPSPWLHWEFGVAQAFGLVWRLLVHRDISRPAWEKIAGDVQCLIFDSDFETQVGRILDALAYLPAERVPHPADSSGATPPAT